jgi:hypothetical protein
LALSAERTIQQFAVIMFAARIVAHAVLKLTPPQTWPETRLRL